MFLVLKKGQIVLFVLLVIVLVFAFIFSFAQKDKNIDLCLDFLDSLNAECENETPEIAEINIPEGFGRVYEDYNLLQKEAGFDLTPLRGQTVMRYSFHLKGEDLIANILIFEGKIIGGDIANISVHGKMLPLIPDN